MYNHTPDLNAFRKMKDNETNRQKYLVKCLLYHEGKFIRSDMNRSALEEEAQKEFGRDNYSIFFMSKNRGLENKKRIREGER